MKSDGKPLSYCIVVDLRELNSQVVNTTCLDSNLEEPIGRICQRYENSKLTPRYFTSLDMKDSFYQIVLRKDSRHLTAL